MMASPRAIRRANQRKHDKKLHVEYRDEIRQAIERGDTCCYCNKPFEGARHAVLVGFRYLVGGKNTGPYFGHRSCDQQTAWMPEDAET